MDNSGRKLHAGAVAPGLPYTVNKTSLYDFAIALFAAANEATSLVDGT
jgi:hypothetical protein